MPTDSRPSETPQLAPVIFANLKEMVKIQRAAHESVLGFSWKKLWPFNQFLPQVDFIRVMRVLEQVRQATRDQHQFLKREKGGAPAVDQPFLSTIPAYLDSLAECCTQLVRLSQYKQDILEKKISVSLKVMNQLLKDYEETQGRMTLAGTMVQKAWTERPQT